MVQKFFDEKEILNQLRVLDEQDRQEMTRKPVGENNPWSNKADDTLF
jgi:hypothetical protein